MPRSIPALLTMTLLTGLSGLVAFGIAGLFRALPWPARWLKSTHWFLQKLWHCAVCAGGRAAILATWIVLNSSGAVVDWRGAAICYFGATGFAAYLYSRLFPPLLFSPEE